MSTVLAALLLVCQWWAQPQTTSAEALFVRATNQTRAAQGLAPLTVDRGLTIQARAWSARLARDGHLTHSDMGWSAAVPRGENLGVSACADEAVHGVGSCVDEIHAALLASPPHRLVLMLPEFGRVGVGTARDTQGYLYVTELFVGR